MGKYTGYRQRKRCPTPSSTPARRETDGAPYTSALITIAVTISDTPTPPRPTLKFTEPSLLSSAPRAHVARCPETCRRTPSIEKTHSSESFVTRHRVVPRTTIHVGPCPATLLLEPPPSIHAPTRHGFSGLLHDYNHGKDGVPLFCCTDHSDSLTL